MIVKDENIVNALLRNQLIDLSLKHNIKHLFQKMMSDDWENYLVCPEKAKTYVYIEKCDEREDSFLIDEFMESDLSTKISAQEYIRKTIVTDEYEQKKTILHQLIMLSKNLNKEIYHFVNTIYNDNELIHLLTFTSEKEYRNAVFYLDDNLDSLRIKEKKSDICSMDLLDILNLYKRNLRPFFIEIKMVETT